MRTIKVVHLTFNMMIGGAEQVIYSIIENTDRLNYEATVLCIDEPVGPFGNILRSKGYCVDSLRRNPGFDVSLIRLIRRYVMSKGIDVLHCHQYTPYVYGVLGAAFTQCRVIFTEHGRFYPDTKRRKRLIVNPFLLYFTDYITAISEATREALVEYENIPRNKIKVVYNGIDDSHFFSNPDYEFKTSLGIPTKASILGTVARLDAIKNQKMMIKALNRVLEKFPNTYLIIVGDGPERKNLEELASSLNLTSNIFFTGFKEDAYRFYQIMDIFLLTSFSEGTAMTLLEAMASRLPIIGTDVGGNPEIIKNGETGYIIPRDDDQFLAEVIERLLSDKSLRVKLGDAGRKRFEDKFQVEHMVTAYQNIYDELT
jgi:glycosyltransferase involved in cell wall biosynthesis